MLIGEICLSKTRNDDIITWIVFILILIYKKNKICKFDAKFIFLKLTNLVLTSFLQSQFSNEIVFSKFLENKITLENWDCKKVVKPKLATSKKIKFAFFYVICYDKVITGSLYGFALVHWAYAHTRKLEHAGVQQILQAEIKF